MDRSVPPMVPGLPSGWKVVPGCADRVSAPVARR